MTTTISSLAECLDASWSEERVQSEVKAHAARTSCAQDEVLDAVALEVARRFDQQKLSHSEAMGKASALYNAVFGRSDVPRQLNAVFWALDKAECGSEQDDPQDDDAPSKRAREKVRAVLADSLRDDA